PETHARVPPDLVDRTRVMFSKAEPGIIVEDKAKPLKCVYQLKTEIYFFDERDSVQNASVTFAGRAYGILGTDDLRRDIFQGVVMGVRVALILGMLYAVIAVSIGVIFGITSAYLGGWTDELMQHINFGWASIPVLPLLILIAAVWKPSIWNIVLLLSIFGWVGVARVARSMGLQLKEETYVEAARAMGAGSKRIIFKHIIPQVAPYAFASMALAVPGAILWEAGLSFLGLGDPRVVTWGKILHDAHDAGATINGMWWWVVPPGLAIALVGLTFVLVGTALDTVLNPKMRRI
ncbi:MAG: ABC transporter permease, partial [Methanobacteriota archaeon]